VVVLLATNLKTCSKCAKTLAWDEFYKKGQTWDSSCKSCISAKKKDTYVSRKLPDPDLFKDIFVMPFKSKIDIDAGELLDALEAFLMEEFESGQAINI